MSKMKESLNMIASSMETGYTALFTFAVKENLSQDEKTRLVTHIRDLADQLED